MAVPNIFGTATSAIPLSQLDTNFATPVTIGNTAVQLGNTVTSFGNVTLTNVTISSGNVTVSAGSNTAPSITTVGDTNTGIFFPAADTIAFSEGGVEAMRIDSSGRVGIGVTSPDAPLHVKKDQTAATYIMSDNGGTVNAATTAGFACAESGNITGFFRSIRDGSGTVQLYNVNNSPLSFGTNNTEQARITGNGLFQFNSGYGSVATAYGCRAWVNWDGTGTPAIRGSGNVSSITDNNVGDYNINYVTSLPDGIYSVSGSVTATGGGSFFINTDVSGAYSASTVRIQITTSAGVTTDRNNVNVAIFR
jgi:hypothetical protein